MDVSSLLHDDRPVKQALTLLRRIASGALPCVLTGDANLLAVSALYRAGHVEAVVRVVVDPMGSFPTVGVIVSEITPLGRLLLQGSLS